MKMMMMMPYVLCETFFSPDDQLYQKTTEMCTLKYCLIGECLPHYRFTRQSKQNLSMHTLGPP